MNITLPTLLIIFFAGIIFTWIIFRFWKYIPQSIARIRHSLGSVRESISGSTETYLLNDIYHITQRQHLAASLFSLDEIVIEPRVLTPLFQSPRSIELAPTDSVSLTIPYIPDWPELAATYNASTMTLVEALQGDANTILANIQVGKTVALAWLAASWHVIQA
jgi:hypothetical protein